MLNVLPSSRMTSARRVGSWLITGVSFASVCLHFTGVSHNAVGGVRGAVTRPQQADAFSRKRHHTGYRFKYAECFVSILGFVTNIRTHGAECRKTSPSYMLQLLTVSQVLNTTCVGDCGGFDSSSSLEIGELSICLGSKVDKRE